MTVAASLIEHFSTCGQSTMLDPGDALVHEGDEADEVFYVVSGTLEALTRTALGDVVVGTVSAGRILGEITTIAGGERNATLRATEPTEVLAIGRAEFEQWLYANPGVADEVSAEARARIDRSQVATMVTELLGTTDQTLVSDILDGMSWQRLEAGEVLFEQGDHSDAAYFVIGGRLRVSTPDADGTERTIAELGRGEVVGELGLLDQAPRSATVRAVRDTTLAAFSTETFQELVAKSPTLMLEMARRILTRLKRPPERRIGRATALTIAVTAPIDPTMLITDIVTELARHGTMKHLSSPLVDHWLNRPDISQATVDNVGVPRLAEFMHEADVGNDFVLLQADRELTPWTRRALRQADRVIIVASQRPDRDEMRHLGSILDALPAAGHAARMLAVHHPAGTERPTGTAALVREVGADEVVHVRAGSTDDAARLARLASGHGVGLVLSGGGARGFAHLGAYRALREAGVPIDHVGGCSMGAPIAAALALQIPDDELLGEVEAQFHRLFDYTLPVVSLIRGERLRRNIEARIGSWDIEDLWLPFFCVSTNLTTSRMVVHRRGRAALAIRASVAIPGLLPPVPLDGDLLVDGGVLNNLPVEVMGDDGTIGTVVAVDVAPPVGPRATLDYGMSVSGLRALGATLRGRGADYPSMSSVLVRSMLTGAVRHQQQSMGDGVVDLLLPLHLPGVGLLEFDRLRAVADAGYVASRDPVAEWAATEPWLGQGP